MKKQYFCKDCGTLKSKKGLYCKKCGYAHRTRPSGLEYNIKVINKTWIKKGQHLSPDTEFKSDGKPYWDNSVGYFKICDNGLPKKYHRYIMEQNIGRSLHTNELVHHINFDKTDNRIENLIIISRSEHMKLHWLERQKNGKK